MVTVSLDSVRKTYPNGYHAVHGLDLDVQDGEFMVLVGPSGCGKTTVLRMIAGLEDITDGRLEFGGKVINHLAPRDRDIAMVFQNYALYPHMTVAENIGFALKLRRAPKDEVQRKVHEAAEILGLTPWLERKPGQLSGGQRQRVAMGRAIVREPSVFLMDEPLSNLDAKLRVQMRSEIARIQRRLGVATFYVTHDQTEAMTMGDRVAVLNNGVLQQCDVPQTLYDRPNNIFVAAFIGAPSMNLYEALINNDGQSLTLASQILALPDIVFKSRPGLAKYIGRQVVIGARPEHLSVPAKPGQPCINAVTELVEALGSEQLVHFSIGAKRVVAPGAFDEVDDELTVSGEGIARAESKAQISVGANVPLGVAVEELQFFDPADGTAIWA
ncbi:ABC transporter ATP-binding protein [Ferrimicrobium sp.]|uniref:ABC transporter ATP-binding protein n=1 Tax=Ferrimicrobium sp. TaxID=2926050 RepID=UPI002619438A|nr:sn-glycerol-3-phosphate ABC transporter ATP-binding protein UgpC [Ferrimicrobium sp.]